VKTLRSCHCPCFHSEGRGKRTCYLPPRSQVQITILPLISPGVTDAGRTLSAGVEMPGPRRASQAGTLGRAYRTQAPGAAPTQEAASLDSDPERNGVPWGVGMAGFHVFTSLKCLNSFRKTVCVWVLQRTRPGGELALSVSHTHTHTPRNWLTQACRLGSPRSAWQAGGPEGC